MLTMYVPEAAQTSISVKQTPDWAIVLKRRATGEVDAEGNPRYAIEQVTWIAKKGDRIQPGFYGEWSFRMQNPATPQRLASRWTSGPRRRRRTGSPSRQVERWLEQRDARVVRRRGGELSEAGAASVLAAAAGVIAPAAAAALRSCSRSRRAQRTSSCTP